MYSHKVKTSISNLNSSKCNIETIVTKYACIKDGVLQEGRLDGTESFIISVCRKCCISWRGELRSPPTCVLWYIAKYEA